MKGIYLSEELKNYYDYSLKKEIDNNNIDEEIVNHLISINKSENIRTLFSKIGEHDYKNHLHSYLRIAYTAEIENTLLNEVIPTFEKDCIQKNNFEYKLYQIDAYIGDIRKATEYNKGSEWLINPNYFNVTQLKFNLEKGSSQLHTSFWNDLENCLSIL